ncbi:unnamed protein product [Durusdinium trenchii]|uniref:Uncharacterized protein n=1 Tax=Durusdinium trenchii TaxID=1381693 RepID=A0ABP0P2S2_9DINO
MAWGQCNCCDLEKTTVEFADALRSTDAETTSDPTFPVLYPFYTMTVETLMEMQAPRGHEDLLMDGSLVIYEKSLGHAMFVSHEWCGRRHPDPEGAQLRVLQEALAHMLHGSEKIPADITCELLFGNQAGMVTSELKASPLYVWFDYFCVPQLVMSLEGLCNYDQQNAIESIPAYVEKSRFFVILCPYVRQDDSNILLSKRTWSTRAWCRLERLASQLHAGESNYMIEVRSARHHSLVMPYEYCRDPVGEGDFTVAEDREKASIVMKDMFDKRLRFFLRQQDFHSFRILLNMQYCQFRGLPLEPSESMIPGFHSNAEDPSTMAFLKFMHQNALTKAIDRDEEGWSPMCYAALRGDPLVMKGLLARGADPNDRVTKATPKIYIVQSTTILVICVFLRHHDALKLLLANGADVHATDDMGSTALHYACVNHNFEAFQILTAAGGQVTTMNQLGHSPRLLAGGAGSGKGSVELVRHLLSNAPKEDASMALHLSILFGGASADVVTALVHAGADIDQPLAFPTFSVLGLLFGFLALRNRWNRTPVSFYAAQHVHATPLMCCIMCGSFEAAATLLALGARLDVQNQNGLTAKDLVAELGAPDFVLSAVHGDREACEALLVTRQFHGAQTFSF